MSLPQLTHDQLLTACDRMNADFQRDGIPLAVIPLKTLLVMQATISQQAETAAAQLTQGDFYEIGTEQSSGILVGSSGSDFILPQSVGGSPRPEHVHLARDTDQDIINGLSRNKQRK